MRPDASSTLFRLGEFDGRLAVALPLNCGFLSHSHFSAAFTAVFGAPPSRTRAGPRGKPVHPHDGPA